MDRRFEIAYSPLSDACIKEDRVAALHLALESYLQIAEMVKSYVTQGITPIYKMSIILLP